MDPADPSRYALFVGQDGLGLPDEEYYRLSQHASILTSYRDHVDRTAAMAGISVGGLPGVVELETEVARRHWDKVRNRDLVAMYNPTSLPDLDATGLAWTSILADAGLPVDHIDTVIVMQPSFAEALPGLLTADRLAGWKAWAKWTAASSLSPYLPEALAQARFDFYGTVLDGTPVMYIKPYVPTFDVCDADRTGWFATVADNAVQCRADDRFVPADTTQPQTGGAS